jgi:ketosteroid isomerase-like protein
MPSEVGVAMLTVNANGPAMASHGGQEMTDQEDIRQVLARFIQLRDDKHFAEWVELFTEDGLFAYGPHALVGRSAIREHVEALLRNDKGKHICVNSIIDVSGETAGVSSDFLKVNPVDREGGTSGYEIGTIGRYEDRFVLRDGIWKIAARRVHIMDPANGRVT